MTADAASVLGLLHDVANPANVEGMRRFGIRGERILGIGLTRLREIGKPLRRDHVLAEELWASGIHEARILACIIDDPKGVTEEQMERWSADFDSWDVCDGCCFGLFDRTPFAYRKAMDWSQRDEEFVKRAGFALMAALAVHDKNAANEAFLPFLDAIRREAGDRRNFVKKAVNWALRQIGKRNLALNAQAIEVATEIAAGGSGRWVASDALRELRSEAVQHRLATKAAR
jgi:3-methyladenine DNA glycosylase AlkD